MLLSDQAATRKGNGPRGIRRGRCVLPDQYFVCPLVLLLVLLEGDWVLVELEELDGVPEPLIELDDERSELLEGVALDALEPDWPHLSIAAWVFGPRMPSIGPGSQPCAFSCCCCWRTDSSPLALALAPDALSEADALFDDLSSVELDGDCDELGDCDLDGDCELVDDAAEGWFALEDCDCA